MWISHVLMEMARGGILRIQCGEMWIRVGITLISVDNFHVYW